MILLFSGVFMRDKQRLLDDRQHEIPRRQSASISSIDTQRSIMPDRERSVAALKQPTSIRDFNREEPPPPCLSLGSGK